jgi:hypothetical protein
LSARARTAVRIIFSSWKANRIASIYSGNETTSSYMHKAVEENINKLYHAQRWLDFRYSQVEIKKNMNKSVKII